MEKIMAGIKNAFSWGGAKVSQILSRFGLSAGGIISTVIFGVVVAASLVAFFFVFLVILGLIGFYIALAVIAYLLYSLFRWGGRA